MYAIVDIILQSDPHTQSKVAKLTSRLYARGAGGKRECATVCAADSRERAVRLGM